MSFSHADVENIIKLLDASHFDELLLEVDGVKLQLRRNGAGSAQMSGASQALGSASATPSVAQVGQPASAIGAAGAAVAPEAVQAESSHDTSLLEVRAPMLGTFYRCPKPGAEPFVSVGSRVDENTVVGIIEVMKLMNSTAAGVQGEIVEILVNDGDLVEYDQPLMRVRA
ncbi:MAG TPA: acetyl-CoA carboxylase biotin carboxyl carrier protein [Pusillimonas sp.]|uniref:acetyl-CoA carboxylase biotin carboxyl carrier protein n=1 Tax=Pusillimonas sp. TaxID=3040095 RepID=UPI002CB2A31B|nr:acetyl-CoA carboxylase biotin carboxyl carrier protein [Pusillimonas sp.]HUH88588.1 acetyl-CoA carboxylase biotin carboxyl carrier protein [Pusillimonas sp.]